MKVLYDITILGRGHVKPSERTGIFRVIENVAEELVRIPECDVKFCTNLSWDDIGLARNYLTSNPKLNKSLSTPLNFDQRSAVKARRTSLINQFDSSSSDGLFNGINSLRLRTKYLKIREKLLGRFNEGLINPKDLDNAQIYHSHFFASFDGIKEAGIKGMFLTSYDIIPILYPQFCGEGMPALMMSILDKLTPDHWVVCISEATRNDLLNYMGQRLDPNKVKVTELAASNIFFESTNKEYNRSVRHQYGIPDLPYILTLCTLEPRKNIEHVIKSFVELVEQEKIADLNLVLVGAKGWKFDRIFDTIASNAKIKDRIIVTGYVNDNDLAAIYSDAMMFTYPSFYEGFGLPPLEAMQCGTPVITSNNSSLPEVVGDAGIMVDAKDISGLCQAILSVYENPSKRKEMRIKSLERAKVFSWDECARKTYNAYQSAITS